MFLKAIDIKGFKSFADKTDLNFKKGITAIVGPNGSGKSNISDAIRWVLGEQSIKSLRGGKMEDVIFSGTEFRKAVGLAQVSLTLDNSDKSLSVDYSEVTVTRKLFRSGESQYLINNTKCRLKDIQELFMDTGIGKEGYSIIGQGKIDAILSGKPEERRDLIEEAAGIVKYKTRKEEAEKKLEKTKENLVRINDIIYSYEERLEPLKTDSEKAKKFLNYANELKTKEVSLIVDSIDKIKAKSDLINEEITKQEEQLHELLSSKDEAKRELEEVRNHLSKLENQNKASEQEYYTSLTSLQEYKSEVNLIEERRKDYELTISKNKIEIDESEIKISQLKELEESLNDKINTLVKQQNDVLSQLNSLNTTIKECNEELINLEKEINFKKNNHINYLSEISELKNKHLLLDNDVKAINEKINDSNKRLLSYENQITIGKSKIGKLSNDIDEVQKINTNSKNEIDENKISIRENEKLLKDLEEKLYIVNNDINKLETTRKILINLENHYEGYNRTIKTLMNHISSNKVQQVKGKAFVLGEIIKVNRKYEIAIETSLGGSISNIVTLNDVIAKNLIDYLKKNKLGRATFLPMNIVKGKTYKLGQSIINNSGYVGMASELVDYDEKFSDIIQYILGRTIVSTDMDSALAIAKELGYKYKIVTLQGEIISPGGSLTGGSFSKKETNIIGRKREISEMSEKIKTQYSMSKKLNFEKDKTKDNINFLLSKNNYLKDDIHKKNLIITKYKTEMDSTNEELKKLQERISLENFEIENMNTNIEKSFKEINEEKNKLNQLEEEKESNERSIEEIEKSIISKRTYIEKLKENLTTYRIDEAKFEESCSAHRKEIDRTQQELKITIVKAEKLDVEREDSLAKIKESERKLNELTERISKEKSNIQFIENKIEDIKVKREELSKTLEKNANEVEDLNVNIQNIEHSKHKKEVVLAKQETEITNLFNKLNEEYELTYAEGVAFKIEIISIEDLKTEINELKSLINSLGVVNVGAIEEYKNINEKFNFMNAQREDLLTTISELEIVIKEMTDKIRKIFRINFIKLRENFNDIFQQLFRGGSADLILSDDDELNGNIEINVQPPGKKLQNINLMSGGEKVLSAIALLFSILKMKPTPFCILDEIEAALDDANIYRYAEFLKIFSENIQFIIITHRKGTMENSDMLYGVTMEEKGVSKIVSVDLVKN